MDPGGFRIFQRFCSAFDVFLQGSRKATDPGFFDGIGDRLDRLEVSGAGNGKARFDDVDSHFLQGFGDRSEEHTSELQSRENLVCRLLLEKKKTVSLLPPRA